MSSHLTHGKNNQKKKKKNNNKKKKKKDGSSIEEAGAPGSANDEYKETVVCIPDLSHTGIRTALAESSGGNIGKNVRKAVTEEYPADDQHALKVLSTQDMSKPVSTASQTIARLQNTRSPLKQSPPKTPYGEFTRRVVLVNSPSMEDPFVNERGKLEKTTKVHELVYNRRMQMPHSRRKTRFTKDILKQLKSDREEFARRVPGV